MRFLVRTWNVFHGRMFPEMRHAHLERMIRLATADRPALLCLQEVPPWALRRLPEWTAMRVDAAATKPALLGSLAWPLQRVDARLVRSPLTGQANAVLVGGGFELVAGEVHELPRAGERRVCQLVRIAAGGRELVLANVHLATDADGAHRQLDTVGALLGGREPAILCGDLNLPGVGLPGFERALPGIDQVLARGLVVVRGPERWPDERRRAGDVLLSDHAPVEAEMMWP